MKFRERSIVGLLLLFNILLSSGCISSSSGNIVSNRMPESSYEKASSGLKYVNNRYKFEVTIPNGWAITEGSGDTVISTEGNVDGFSGASVAVVIKPIPNNARDADIDRMPEVAKNQFYDGFIAAYIRKFPGVKISQPASGYDVLGGKRAILISSQLHLPSSAIVRNRSYSVIKDGLLYQFIEAVTYSTEDAKRDQEMVKANKGEQLLVRGEKVANQFKTVRDTFQFK